MMDSTVLRLIRRYDPVGPKTAGNQTRRSLESTRGLWNTIASKSEVPQITNSSPYLLQRSLTTTYEDEIPVKQPSTPRLQRQQAIQDSETILSPPTDNSLRPILKYGSSRARSEFIVQPNQIEPLTIDIEAHTPPINENTSSYQSLVTIGTKRTCSAISKSEWDLRVQQEQNPIQSSSPPSMVINVPQEKEFSRPTLGRSKSLLGINDKNKDQDNDADDFDENSAPITHHGSCVEKLKQLFVTKSSFNLTNSPVTQQHRVDSVDSNLNRQINLDNKTNISSSSSFVQSPLQYNTNENSQQKINKPATIVQDVTPTSSFMQKTPIIISQKTIDRYCIQ